jgi:hypothetical protein
MASSLHFVSLKNSPLNSSNARIINFLRDFISELGDDQSPDTQNTSASRKLSEHTLIRDSNGNVLHPHTLTLSEYTITIVKTLVDLCCVVGEHITEC